MAYQTVKINESVGNTVKLDNQDISTQDFNEKLENLKPNQRIVETSKNNFHTVERFYD